VLRSRDYINNLIKAEIEKGISPARIVLGGFSQGGAISLFTGITNAQKLAGVFGLSCYLLLSDKLKQLSPEGELSNQHTPIFIAHGTDDDVVKFEFGQKSVKRLKDLGFDVEFHGYPYVASSIASHYLLLISFSYSSLGHSADPMEIQDLEKFISKALP
jgi:predicted esterase